MLDDKLNSGFTTRVSVKLTQAQKEEVDRIAMLKGLSASTYLRTIIVKSLYKKEGK